MAGMQPAIEGNILLRGKELSSFSQRELSMYLSVVLTDRIDVGFLTGYALVALGRHPYTGWSGKITKGDDEAVRRAIEALHAQPLMHRYVAELSDGERQKIMIARALAQEPRLMLLDEPTAFLDVPRRVEIMQLLKKLARETGKSIFLSTHDLELALRSADRVFLLSMDGSLRGGVPEDLVLRGAFEETFHSEGVRFDREYGHFTISEQKGHRVAMEGRGIGVHWTRRALARSGYRIVRPGKGERAVIDVMKKGDAWGWESSIIGKTMKHDSLEDLLFRLRKELP
jgi:iron complex transport system ATP-binding protein